MELQQPPALGRSEVKGKMNVRWLKVKEGSAVESFRWLYWGFWDLKLQEVSIDFRFKLINSGFWKTWAEKRGASLLHWVSSAPGAAAGQEDLWIIRIRKCHIIYCLRPDHFKESSRLAGVSPVVSVHFCQQCAPLVDLGQICCVSFFLFMGTNIFASILG